MRFSLIRQKGIAWSPVAAIHRIVQTGRPKSLSTKGQLSRNNQTEFSQCSSCRMPAKHQKGLVWNWEEGNGSWLSNVLIIDVSESQLSILPNEGCPRDPSTGHLLLPTSTTQPCWWFTHPCLLLTSHAKWTACGEVLSWESHHEYNASWIGSESDAGVGWRGAERTREIMT